MVLLKSVQQKCFSVQTTTLLLLIVLLKELAHSADMTMPMATNATNVAKPMSQQCSKILTANSVEKQQRLEKQNTYISDLTNFQTTLTNGLKVKKIFSAQQYTLKQKGGLMKVFSLVA